MPIFQLIARSPQASADLCLIAQRIAEMSLVPGVLFSTQNFDYTEYDFVHSADFDMLEKYLGSPEDMISSPTSFQQELFGATRRRIPERDEKFAALKTATLLSAVPDLCQEAMRDFEQRTGRSYNLVEEIKTSNAEILIISLGKSFDFLHENLDKIEKKAKIGLLHPTLVHPFPGAQVCKALKGKKACLVLSNDSEPNSHPLLQEFQLGFDRAFANGRAESSPPFHDYPIYKNVQDRPVLYSGYSSEIVLDLDKLCEAISQIKNGAALTTVLDFSRAKKHSEKKRARAAAENALHIHIDLPNAHALGKSLSESLHSLLNLHISLAGSPLAGKVYLQLASKKSGAHTGYLPADILISQAVSDLDSLKNSGLWLCMANRETLAKKWYALSESKQTAIVQKKPNCFIFESQLPQENEEHTGELLGALLKVAEIANAKLFQNNLIAAAMDLLASNCNLQFAQAVQHGFESIQEIDLTQLAALPEEQVFEEQQTGVREEKLQTPPDGEPVLPETDHFKTQLRFCASGEMSASSRDFVRQPLIPALLFGHANLERIRYAYPVCLPENHPEKYARPLTDIFDNLLGELAGEIDDSERMQHNLLLLEAQIKKQLANKPAQKLSQLWDLAVAAMLEKSPIDAKQQELRREDFRQAREKLDADGMLIDCDQLAPARLMQAAALFSRRVKYEKFEQVLDEISSRLAEILQANFSKSSEAHDPEYLKKSLGQAYSDELDFDELSHLLETTPEDNALQENRRVRIENTLATINAIRESLISQEFTPMRHGEASSEKRPDLSPRGTKQSPDSTLEIALLHSSQPKTPRNDKKRVFSTNEISTVLGQALAYSRKMLMLFRAAHIARLEVNNKYREDKYDRYFAEFDFRDLTTEEAALIPPYFVHIHSAHLDEIDRSALVEILTSELPIKVLLTIDNLNAGEILATDAINFSTGINELANMARSLNKAFVLQSTLSNLEHLVAGFRQGILCDSPALFCVFTGAATESHLPNYLESAAALESRLFPAFTLDPSAGEDWADKFTIALTPQFEKAWPISKLEYENAEGEQTMLECTFTPADFLALDARFSKHFLPVSRQEWHEQMLPVAEFASDFRTNIGQKIPFILMASENGTLYRVVVSYAVAAAVANTLANWKNLHELGGVNNSYVLRLVQKEKESLEEEKQREIEAIEERHKETLDKAVGEVAQEIVSNIAAGLLDQGRTAPAGFVTPAPIPAKAEPAPKAEAELQAKEQIETAEAEEEETETLSLDEAYIETVRCTSCNECTNINPQLFAYNAEKQAYIKDVTAGTYRELVTAAEKCPVRIIHPGKPVNPNEAGLDDLMKRAEPFL